MCDRRQKTLNGPDWRLGVVRAEPPPAPGTQGQLPLRDHAMAAANDDTE